MRAIVIAQPTKRKRTEPSPAWQLYTGSQQRLVQAGLRVVWGEYGFRQGIDEVILSPWHGPVEPEAPLVPYDFTWKGRPRVEVEQVVRQGRMIERLAALVQGYDTVLVLLSRVYLAPLQLNDWVPTLSPQRWLFFASGEGLPFVPVGQHVRVIAAGTPEARRERVKVLDVKSYLFGQLCVAVARDGEPALEAAWQAAAPTV